MENQNNLGPPRTKSNQIYADMIIKFIQESITRSLHLPYKPLESTLSDEELFIEIVFAENLPRPNA